MFYFLIFSLGCTNTQQPIIGQWNLTSPTALGVIQRDAKSLQIGIWGEKWGTDGMVPAKMAMEEDVYFFYFSLHTGLGIGDATLRLQGQEALLPLGSRPREFEISFLAEKTDDSILNVNEIQKQNKSIVEQEQQYWKKGHFLLQSGEQIVGDFHYQPQNGETTISVYDKYWLTSEPQYPTLITQGADLMISFPVSPSLKGENGLILINIPTRQAVIPVGEVPDRLDRHLSLSPGQPSQQERSKWIKQAEQLADKIEKNWVTTNADSLIKAATTPNGCSSFEDLDPKLQALWLGYNPQIILENGKCIVELHTKPIQHRRRYKGRVE